MKEYIIDLCEIIVSAENEEKAIKKVKRMIKARDIQIASVEENIYETEIDIPK